MVTETHLRWWGPHFVDEFQLVEVESHVLFWLVSIPRVPPRGFPNALTPWPQKPMPKAPTPKKRMPQMSISSPNNAWKHRPGSQVWGDHGSSSLSPRLSLGNVQNRSGFWWAKNITWTTNRFLAVPLSFPSFFSDFTRVRWGLDGKSTCTILNLPLFGDFQHLKWTGRGDPRTFGREGSQPCTLWWYRGSEG